MYVMKMELMSERDSHIFYLNAMQKRIVVGTICIKKDLSTIICTGVFCKPCVVLYDLCGKSAENRAFGGLAQHIK